MPRDGSGVYTTPAGTTAVPDTTIESAKYNANVADVAADLNAPRPIVAGGTGGNSAATARANLKAEVSSTQVINYDTHVFEPGSFYSIGGATGAPNAGSFTGICYGSDDANITVEARTYNDAVSPGRVYVRERVAGVWKNGGAWTLDEASTFVLKSGDVMIGDLSIQKANPTLRLIASAAGQGMTIVGQNEGLTQRWAMELGSPAAESGGSSGGVGRDFILHRYMNDGSYGGAVLSVSRATARVTIAGDLSLGADSGATSTALRLHNGTGNPSILQKSGADLILRGQEGGPGAIIYGGTGNFACANITCNAANVAGDFNVGGITTLARPLRVGVAPFPAGYAMNINSAGTYALAILPGSDGMQQTTYLNAAAAIVGNVTCSSTTTTYNTSSDAALKEDLKSFDAGNIIDNTNVYDFAWRATGERAFGVIAQQAIEVYPTAVYHAEKDEKNARDEWWGVDYSKYVPVLLQELKALRARVAQLEGRTDTKPPPS